MPQRIKPENKKHINCLFITKLSSTSLYDLGLLTDDYNCYQCDIRTKYKNITTNLWLKLRHTFLPFQFSKTTVVILTNNISVYEPIAYYLKILQEQIHFQMNFVDQAQIIRRILAYHPTYLRKHNQQKLNFKDVNKLWDKLLKYEKCPWITFELNNELKLTYYSYQRRVKYLRLGLYYSIVRQHLSLKNKV